MEIALKFVNGELVIGCKDASVLRDIAMYAMRKASGGSTVSEPQPPVETPEVKTVYETVRTVRADPSKRPPVKPIEPKNGPKLEEVQAFVDDLDDGETFTSPELIDAWNAWSGREDTQKSSVRLMWKRVQGLETVRGNGGARLWKVVERVE